MGRSENLPRCACRVVTALGEMVEHWGRLGETTAFVSDSEVVLGLLSFHGVGQWLARLVNQERTSGLGRPTSMDGQSNSRAPSGFLSSARKARLHRPIPLMHGVHPSPCTGWPLVDRVIDRAVSDWISESVPMPNPRDTSEVDVGAVREIRGAS